MSDSTGPTPPREGGPFRDDDAGGFAEPPPENTAGGSADRSNLPALNLWVTRWRERLFAWLEGTLSRHSGAADPFYLNTVLPVMARSSESINERCVGALAALYLTDVRLTVLTSS